MLTPEIIETIADVRSEAVFRAIVGDAITIAIFAGLALVLAALGRSLWRYRATLEFGDESGPHKELASVFVVVFATLASVFALVAVSSAGWLVVKLQTPNLTALHELRRLF